MIQTKLYSAVTPMDLQESINIWIQENAQVKVVDIKYTTAQISDGAAPNWQAAIRVLFTALIIYESRYSAKYEEDEEQKR